MPRVHLHFKLLCRCAYYETDDHQQACDNANFFNVSSCARKICWETAVGVEFYRLTVLDLLTQILVIIGLDVWRVRCIGKLEFNIPKHVLDIVYSQTICWMGLFFAPLLSLITLIKLLSLFYIRLSYLKNWCQPSKTFYEVHNNAGEIKSISIYSTGVSDLLAAKHLPAGLLRVLLHPHRLHPGRDGPI